MLNALRYDKNKNKTLKNEKVFRHLDNFSTESRSRKLTEMQAASRSFLLVIIFCCGHWNDRDRQLHVLTYSCWKRCSLDGPLWNRKLMDLGFGRNERPSISFWYVQVFLATTLMFISVYCTIELSRVSMKNRNQVVYRENMSSRRTRLRQPKKKTLES